MNIEPTFRAASVEQVKQELRRVLESSTFRQSPALSRLLQYLCGKAICETPQQVTEYTLAVDVFGKPPNFKDSKDAIVRVEMHRLRKRLAQFYEEAGDATDVRIVIPPGQYLPEFRVTSPTPLLATRHEAIEGTIPVTVVPARARTPRPFLLVAIGTASLVATAVIGGFLLANTGRVGNRLAVGVDKREVRILAGLATGSHVDASGRVWQADRYYKGGAARAGPKDLIPRPPNRALFQWLREGAGPEKLLPEKSSSFGYDIPLKRGTYDMRLYFADPLYENPLLESGQDGQNIRRFRVTANGRALLEQFDAVADSGYAAVDVRAFKGISPASDGLLHLEFIPDPHQPFVNAIELIPSSGGKANPIRISARLSPYTDPEGKTWNADDYFIRGRMIQHPIPEGAPKLPGLYASERYGNFSYAIPVPPGIYAVTLHFAETMFTPFAASTICRGPGCRVFDVSCNGVLLLRNFDIFQSGGGAFKPVVRTFHNLQPNGQGKLLLSFSPSVNYGEIRAIEVVDETP